MTVEAIITRATIEVDGGAPLFHLNENEYLKVSTPDGCLRVRVTSQGEIEVHATNAPHKGQPELQVIPLVSNNVIIRTELK